SLPVLLPLCPALDRPDHLAEQGQRLPVPARERAGVPGRRSPRRAPRPAWIARRSLASAYLRNRHTVRGNKSLTSAPTSLASLAESNEPITPPPVDPRGPRGSRGAAAGVGNAARGTLGPGVQQASRRAFVLRVLRERRAVGPRLAVAPALRRGRDHSLL